jgi:hypothetical protein
VEDSDVVGKWTERQLEDVRRRNPVLDLHRSLVHHQHRARRNDEQNWNKLKLKKKDFSNYPKMLVQYTTSVVKLLKSNRSCFYLFQVIDNSM